jgi:hypothetical protein
MPQPDPTTAPDFLPALSRSFYGRSSEVYVDDEGSLVVGHDRRSWAALNAIYRDVAGGGRVEFRHIRRIWAIGTESRYVELDELICPGCGEQVNNQPPADQPAAEVPLVSEFSHHDGSALCPRPGGAPAEPIEVSW